MFILEFGVVMNMAWNGVLMTDDRELGAIEALRVFMVVLFGIGIYSSWFHFIFWVG